MVLVSVTRLRVRSWRFMPPFFIGALRSARQASRADGNVAASLLREASNTFWTRTIWESEQAMRAFMLAGVHRPLMRRLLEWCDEASVVHWEQEEAELPSWEDAHARMQRDGRRSKVNHPSHAHTAYEIPLPVVRRTGALRFR